MSYLLSGLLFFGLFIADRISKWLIISSAVISKRITSWLSFDLYFNRGVSWGMFHSANEWVFLGVSAFVVLITCVVAFYAVYEWQHKKPIYGHMMVLAGSSSNILDRMVCGGVIDFIHVHIGTWSFAIFNIADVAIVLGVCIMMIQVIINDDNKS